ncbi:MAG: CHAD domain-containing protein [Elusimicrobiota bacterium]|nr:CHAD domain-containing protein [Elusimicrobiota bacterium]
MKIKLNIKKKKSFRSNARKIINALFDKMLSYQTRVIDHPLLLKDLHKMRIASKPLRYMMELCEPVFGREFRTYYQQIKQLVELMGIMHDIDIALPLVKNQCNEIRLLNRILKRSKKIQTKSLVNLIRCLKEKREKLFIKLCNMLNRWARSNFKNKVVASMEAG